MTIVRSITLNGCRVVVRAKASDNTDIEVQSVKCSGNIVRLLGADTVEELAKKLILAVAR
jgi:hypothetical protein